MFQKKIFFNIKKYCFFLCCFLVSINLSLFIFVKVASSKKVYLIMVPSECVVIDKVERNRVYVVDDQEMVKKGICDKKRTNVSFRNVVIDDGKVDFIEVYYNGKLWRTFNVRDILSEESVLTYSVKSFREEVDNLVGSIGGSLDNETIKRIQEEVKKAENYIQSEEFQARVEFFRDHLSKLLLGDYYDTLLKQKSKEGRDMSDRRDTVQGAGLDNKSGSKLGLQSHERIYVFVSSSLPDEVVSSYVRAVDELRENRIVFVLRGAIDGMTYIGPTVNWVMRFMLKDRECIVSGDSIVKGCRLYAVRFIIDPLLYRKYKVDKVPAVLYVSGVKTIEDFSEGLEDVSFDRAVVSYGDVDFYYHLYQIGKVTKDKRFLTLAKEKLRYFLGDD